MLTMAEIRVHAGLKDLPGYSLSKRSKESDSMASFQTAHSSLTSGAAAH